MLGQIHAFDVYVPSGDTYMKHNTEVSPLWGRFCHNTLNVLMQGLNVRERNELLASRRLQFPADYDMPDNARIYWFNDPMMPNGVSIWNTAEGTDAGWNGVGGYNVVNTVQVNRIDNVG